MAVASDDLWRPMDLDDPRIRSGIDAQLRCYRGRLDRGEQPIGWKVGINDAGTRVRLGLRSCITGYLTDASVCSSDSAYSLQGMTLPGVEPEVAIYLRDSLPAGADRKAAGASIAEVGSALEINDYRGRLEDLEGVIEGNMFHRSVLFGAKRIPFKDGCLVEAYVTARRNDEVRWQLPIVEVVGDVRDTVRFFADSLAALSLELRPGDRIIAGSLTPLPLWARPGDRISAEMGTLGSVSLSFCE